MEYNENKSKVLKMRILDARGGFMGENLKNEKKSKATYVIGSIALTAAAFVVVPKVMEWGATKLYASKERQKPEYEDDWGPEIVRTDSLKKEKKNEKL